MSRTFKESFKINYSANIFIDRAMQCVRNLGWSWISDNANEVVAAVPPDHFEKITIQVNGNNVTITSLINPISYLEAASSSIANFKVALTMVATKQRAIYEAEKARRLRKLIGIANMKANLRISESDALHFLESATFKEIRNHHAEKTSLYLYFQRLYNFEPYLLRFECVEQMKFSELIENISALEGYEFANETFKNNAFGKLVTNLTIKESDYGIKDLTNNFVLEMELLTFEKLSPYDFNNHLYQLIRCGGVYTRSQINDNEAKEASNTFVEMLFENRIDDFVIYYSTDGWSGWYYGRGWDMTYLIFDKGLGEFTLFAKTDGS